MELTREQHLAIIHALAEQVGGRLTFLNNKIPAYRPGPEGTEWVKLNQPGAIDAFRTEKKTGMAIESLPTKSDSLGGIAKIKDHRLLAKVLEAELPEFSYGMEPEQVANQVVSSLDASGMQYNKTTFKNTLSRIFQRTKHTQSVLGQLDIAGERFMWTDHHLPSQAPEIPESDRDNSQGYWRINNPDYLKNAVTDTLKDHYMQPELYVMGVHAILRKQNIALVSPGYRGDPDVLPDDVRRYLMDVREAYKHGGASVLDVAISGIESQYRPRIMQTRTVPAIERIGQLRQAVKSGPENTPSPIRVGQDPNREKTLELAAKISTRARLWTWKGILLSVVNTTPSLPKDQMLAKWDSIFPSGVPTFNDASSKELSTLVQRVEKIYGSIVEKTAHDIIAQLRDRIDTQTGDMEEVSSPLLRIVKMYRVQESLSEWLNLENVHEYKRQGANGTFQAPDEEVINTVRVGTENAYRYSQEPDQDNYALGLPRR